MSIKYNGKLSYLKLNVEEHEDPPSKKSIRFWKKISRRAQRHQARRELLKEW